MSITRTRQMFEDKKKMIEIEEQIQQNTREVFDILKRTFKKAFVSEDYPDISITSENNESIAGKIYDTTIGCSIIKGVGQIKDTKLVSKTMLEQLSYQNTRQIALDPENSKLLTGMIVVFSSIEGSRNGVVSRFYVNNDKTVFFKAEMGWTSYQQITAAQLDNELPGFIESSIEVGLFETKSYWNPTHQAFDHPSELGISNKIGF
ncbi:MAG: hypothetical protein ACQEWE_21615 [Bacillota bacterium]